MNWWEKTMVVNKYDIKKKRNIIKRDDAFDLEQKRSIKYAMWVIGINEDLIVNPNIPSDYMDMYIRLMIKGIDVTKYIVNQWRLKDIKAEDLERAIMAENQGKKDLNDANKTRCTPIQVIESDVVTEECTDLQNTKQKVMRRNI